MIAWSSGETARIVQLPSPSAVWMTKRLDGVPVPMPTLPPEDTTNSGLFELSRNETSARLTSIVWLVPSPIELETVMLVADAIASTYVKSVPAELKAISSPSAKSFMKFALAEPVMVFVAFAVVVTFAPSVPR